MNIRKIIQSIQKGDGKVLFENFVALSSLQFVGMVLPLLTLPYVLRVIGFEKYGVIVFAASLIAYFQSLTDYSFRITAVRDVAIFRNSPKKLNVIYSKVLIVKSIFLILSLLIIATVVLLTKSFHEYKGIYALSSLMLVGYAIFPEWFFQGIEKMKYVTYLNLGIKFFFTLCIFLFIREEKDYWIYPLLQGLGLIFGGVVGQLLLTFKYKIKFKLLPFKYIKSTIIGNFPLFVNQFVPTLYNNTSTFLLGIFEAKAVVGVYQALLTVINLGATLLDIFSRVCFPYLNRKKGAFHKYKKLIFSIASLIFVGILTVHKIIFWYLDLNLKNSFWVLFILAFSLIGYTLSNIFGLNYFIVRRQDKLVMKNTVIASLTGFILAFPLIHFLGIVGAALNLCLGRWLMGGGVYRLYLIETKKQKNRL
ncbi:oligosaccharide flippase family protein [Myroides sp. LJL116]